MFQKNKLLPPPPSKVQTTLNLNHMSSTLSNLFAVTSLILLSTTANAQCADTANIFTFGYNGHTYEVVKETSTWTDASSCAVTRGGYLAEINDMSEQNAIFAELTANAGINISNTQNQFGTASVWLGGSDAGVEGEWIWDGNNDGVGLQFWEGGPSGMAIGGLYTNWGVSPAEPDNSGGQDYLTIIIKPTATSFSLWNDLISTNAIYYLIEFDSGLGIEENELLNKVRIYPNPAAKYIMFDNSSSININQIEIYDNVGKKVNSSKVESSQNGIDVSTLNQGIYEVLISFENGNQVRKRFVKE